VEHEAAEEAAMAHGQSASTGITLATRAANILAQAEDLLIFQGKNALKSPLFSGNTAVVNHRGDPPDRGLLNINVDVQPQPQPDVKPKHLIQVHPAQNVKDGPYQGNTVTAVAKAYSVLQAWGHYGPYALVLATLPYADTHSPLPNT